MSAPDIADQQYTIDYYLRRSARDALPLDRRFVRAPLSAFVKRGREAALEQYLFAHALASGEDDGRFDVRLPATTWARAIGGWFDPDSGEVASSALHLVSRNWRFLEQLQLVERERAGRRARVSLLADDGSGDPYTRPGRGRRGKRLANGEPGYLQLPYAYWRDQWHTRLDLAGKAMLLIGLSLGDGYVLPYARMPEWYGISPSTAERGLQELRANGLLYRERHRRAEPESPVGFTDNYHYELLPPFGPRGIRSASAPPTWKGPTPPRARRGGRR